MIAPPSEWPPGEMSDLVFQIAASPSGPWFMKHLSIWEPGQSERSSVFYRYIPCLVLVTGKDEPYLAPADSTVYEAVKRLNQLIALETAAWAHECYERR